MKKFMLITGITGIVCNVLGVVMVTVSLVAGGNFSSVVRNGPVRRHNDWEWEHEWEWNWDEMSARQWEHF